MSRQESEAPPPRIFTKGDLLEFLEPFSDHVALRIELPHGATLPVFYARYQLQKNGVGVVTFVSNWARKREGGQP